MAGKARAPGTGRLALTDHDIERRKAFVGLDAADIVRIRSLRPLMERRCDHYVAGFFNHLQGIEEAAPLFRSEAVVREARLRKHEHLMASVAGEYGIPYMEQRIALGLLYSSVELDPRVFLGAFHHLMRAIGTDIMAEFAQSPDEAFQRFLSLKKVAFFDIGLIVDVLIDGRERIIEQELSTPVLQLREHLLILPIIGVLDSVRARQLTDSLLSAIRARRTKVVVMDITGVPVMDSLVANSLTQTVEACRLMGVTAIVTGISGAVAQALVTLGIDVSVFNAMGDLQRGIEEAGRLLGAGVAAAASGADPDLRAGLTSG